MAMPFGFDREAVKRYQKLIDRITGLARNEHSIIKLVWMPEVFEWRPYPLGSNPTGYTFPGFLALWDKDGNEVAAPRWALMERCEPEQYLPGWENDRWVFINSPSQIITYDDFGNEVHEKGRLHDAKGDPPPNGLYTRWHRHLDHQDGCCLRAGNEDDCWGYYVEPNAQLLEYIAEKAWLARNDKEVQPTTPVALLPENRSGNSRTAEKLEKSTVESNPNINIIPRFRESPYIWTPE